ncbi:iron chelate uptake ABC transporter family permease subunit [Nocardioides zeae]|uniref:Iron chelate uptake ABC transporter family permease subunit n=1 Tax=Nocardioides imazamoxiresistens TaxID=3231893 RepID=A0ABU3PYD0_9ACTN|nr:iron chelate uptake ABC transporter family permease subunit [Nocardioides zeae]MDT9594245.1 iron chelate uptake ABC transporter family permease subunit [Nocardioides zeae]
MRAAEREAPRGALVVGGERAHVGLDRRELAVCGVLGVAALVLGFVGLWAGDFPLTAGEVVGALLGPPFPVVEPIVYTVVVEWHLPRVVAALVFGAALAASGAIFQTVTRNPLASPDVMGLANGSFTGMLLALVVLGGSWAGVMTGALVGGLLTAGAIYLLALRDGLRDFRFIVVGIGVSAFLAAANSWILLRIDVETALFASAWGAGTLNNATAGAVWPAAAFLLGTLALLPFGLATLRQVELGDDLARATGVALDRHRALLLLLAVALVSAVTTVAGPVAFVALAAPQIARRLAGSPGIPMGASLATGAVLLLSADLVAQHVVPLTVPVGVVTVVIGGVYLTWLLRREMRTRG